MQKYIYRLMAVLCRPVPAKGYTRHLTHCEMPLRPLQEYACVQSSCKSPPIPVSYQQD